MDLFLVPSVLKEDHYKVREKKERIYCIGNIGMTPTDKKMTGNGLRWFGLTRDQERRLNDF